MHFFLSASLKVENSELRDENRELEERHWSLESMMVTACWMLLRLCRT